MTWKSLFAGEKGKKILIFSMAAVIVLLLLSSVTHSTKNASSTALNETSEDAAEIEQTLEKRLEELLGRIEGVGAVSVMVTLDRSSQTLFEKDEKTEINTKSESDVSSENAAREAEVVLAGSGKEPLRVGTVQPKVRGAAVVCGGANDPVIREKVANTVAKALNIGISRVYVTE